jgi:hypothetical protein
MVCAILSGAKTQTRRAVKEPRWAVPGTIELDGNFSSGVVACACATGCHAPVLCPYGEPGDLLWCRESFWYRADEPMALVGDVMMFHPSSIAGGMRPAGYQSGSIPLTDDEMREAGWNRRPSIHMPRWASRITLRVTGVRVERVGEITPADVLAEGVRIPCTPDGKPLIRLTGNHPPTDFLPPRKDMDWSSDELLRAEFASLWCEINGRESWDADPFCWVVSFERVKP